MRVREFVREDHSLWSIADDQLMDMMEEYGHLFYEGITTEDLDQVEQYLNVERGISSLTDQDIGKKFFPVSAQVSLIPYQDHPSLINLAYFDNGAALTDIGKNYCTFNNTKMVNSRTPELLKHVLIFQNKNKYGRFLVPFTLRFTGTSGTDWKIKEKQI